MRIDNIHIDGSRAESGRLGPTTFRYFFFQKFFFQSRPESARVEKSRPDSKKSRPESARVEFFLGFFFLVFFCFVLFFFWFFFLEKILLWGGPTRAEFFFDSGRLFFLKKNFFRLGPSRPDQRFIYHSRTEAEPHWKKGFSHFLGNWVADRTMKSRTIQAVPNFFFACGAIFPFLLRKKGFVE